MKKLGSFTFSSRVLPLLVGMFFFFSQRGFTQYNVDRKNEVTLHTLSPILSTAPRYNVGYYRHLTPNLKIGLTAGYGNKRSSILKGNYDTSEKYQLWEVRPEISYLYRLKKKTPHFVSLEYFYIRHTDVFHKSRYYEDWFVVSFEQADYKRVKSGLTINYGMQISLAPNFGIIPQIGLGFKNRMVSFDDLVNERVTPNDNDHYSSDMFGTSNYLEHAGRHINFQFSGELKLFYRF